MQGWVTCAWHPITAVLHLRLFLHVQSQNRLWHCLRADESETDPEFLKFVG